MNVIKRSGEEVIFDASKIENAIKKANKATTHNQMSDELIRSVTQSVIDKCENLKRSPNVEEIQDMVEDQLMAKGAFELARRYVRYRYNRSLVRKANTTDNRILSLIECNNEEVKQENSNKNPTVNSVQRDYMAGEVSRDLTRRMLLPADIVEADKEGIIHFHDSDYFAQHMHNCDLVNLEDMLQNGTVISDTLIERPHSFSTACNIATQIIAQVASNQYGGQSISLAHLAPFVQVSREKIRRETLAEIEELGVHPTEEKINDIVEQRLRKEVNRGVQTIQYQVVTLLTTNGQAPFVTVFMYLNEAKNEQEKHDLAMIIEETLKQRHKGVKNEKGVWITPAFPKLIYVLEEDNITEDSKYWYLTELAAKCTAKRMVPDYISEKVMLQSKIDKNGEGHCFTCMGCRSFLTPYVDENGKPKYYGRFNQGVVTVNLIDIGLSAGKDLDKFWKIFDERMELCHIPQSLASFLFRKIEVIKTSFKKSHNKCGHLFRRHGLSGFYPYYEQIDYRTANSSVKVFRLRPREILSSEINELHQIIILRVSVLKKEYKVVINEHPYKLIIVLPISEVKTYNALKITHFVVGKILKKIIKKLVRLMKQDLLL